MVSCCESSLDQVQNRTSYAEFIPYWIKSTANRSTFILYINPRAFRFHPISSACLGEVHGLLPRRCERLDPGLICTGKNYAVDFLYIGAE